ncbi:unnamed protein product [Allacma fusca]|uniref:DUF4806 domain-containing protein n=1 Tax=Allacma fusca TaxID=39272 RepID=A0A8J2J6E8_9HEXA|nr:unnamed protein product [Allacma fusca]
MRALKLTRLSFEFSSDQILRGISLARMMEEQRTMALFSTSVLQIVQSLHISWSGENRRRIRSLIRMFVVVEFSSRKGVREVEAVPESWLTDSNKNCYWPPPEKLTISQITVAIKSMKIPDKDKWPKYGVCKFWGPYESYLLARQKANRSEKVTDISSSGERGRGKRKRTTNLPASSPKKIRKRKQLKDNLSSSESDTNNNTVGAGLQIPTLKSPTGIETNFGGIFNNPRGPNLIRSSGGRSRETSVELDDAIDTVPVPGRTSAQRLHSPVASCSTERPQTSQNFVSISFETLQTLVQSVELIKVRQKHYGDLLEFLSSKLDHMPQGLPEKRTQAIKLPLRTMTELDELERAMTNDDIEAELYCLLFGIGGNSVGDTTRNCLAKLVSNNVAANLNWKGRGNKQGGIEKRGFSDFRICQTLSRSVFEFYKRKQSLTNIEKAIKDWLKQAPYRKNGGGLISEQQQETTENCDC